MKALALKFFFCGALGLIVCLNRLLAQDGDTSYAVLVLAARGVCGSLAIPVCVVWGVVLDFSSQSRDRRGAVRGT